MTTVTDLSIVDRLTCPWCGKMAFNIDPDTFTGSLTCAKCNQNWWATRVQGDIRSQLLADFEGDAALVDSFIAAFNLPASAPEGGAFWQIRLAGRQSYRFHTNPERRANVRSIALLRGVIALLRPAS